MEHLFVFWLQWKLKQMDQLPLPKKEMDYEY